MTVNLAKLIAPFGSLFPRRGLTDLEKVEKLQKEVRYSKAVDDLSKTKGWHELAMKIAEGIVGHEAEILRLSSDPVTHKSRLVYLSAHREAALKLLGLVDAAVRSRPHMTEELERKLDELRDELEFPEISGARMKAPTADELFRTSV